MKLSEVVERLDKLFDEHGDIDVLIGVSANDGLGGYKEFEIDDIYPATGGNGFNGFDEGEINAIWIDTPRDIK